MITIRTKGLNMKKIGINSVIGLLGFLCIIIVLPVASAAEKIAAHDAALTASNHMVTYIKQGNHADLEKLVLAGADVNKADTEGQTPLIQAVKSSDIEVVRLLLKYGANPEAVSAAENVPPLCVALADDHLEIAQLLMDYGVNPIANFTTARRGIKVPFYLCAFADKKHGELDVPLYELFIRSGFILTDKEVLEDVSGYSGETLLHIFAESGNLYGLNKWAEAGFGFNGLSNTGEHALHYAMHSRLYDETSLKVVRFLVEKGATVTDVNQKGETPRMKAKHRGKFKTAAYLLQHGG